MTREKSSQPVKNRFEVLEMLQDWDKMCTDGAKHLSDKRLLEVCAHSRVQTGWGNLAELMKRFDRLTGE